MGHDGSEESLLHEHKLTNVFQDQSKDGTLIDLEGIQNICKEYDVAVPSELPDSQAHLDFEQFLGFCEAGDLGGKIGQPRSMYPLAMYLILTSFVVLFTNINSTLVMANSERMSDRAGIPMIYSGLLIGIHGIATIAGIFPFTYLRAIDFKYAYYLHAGLAIIGKYTFFIYVC